MFRGKDSQMAYRIEGLNPQAFDRLFALPDAELADQGALRVTADAPRGYPCRITLADAAPGDRLVLINYLSHDVDGPFRTTYAIYVREDAAEPAHYVDAVPDMLDRRTLGLRGFDADGMLKDALIAQPGEADARIRDLFARTDIATIHAHNAAQGCFLARIERN
jgi:hypothetical protein